MDQITHGKVVGRILLGAATTPETHPLPHYQPIPSARVVFRADPASGVIAALMATDPTSLLLQTFTVETDDDGYLIDAAGTRGVTLPSNVDPDLRYAQWPWIMTIEVPGHTFKPQRFVLREYVNPGDEVDVTTLTEIPTAPGEALTDAVAQQLRLAAVAQHVRDAGTAAVDDINDAGAGVEERAATAATAAARGYSEAAAAARDDAVAAKTGAQQKATDAAASASQAAASASQAAASAASINTSTSPTAGTVPVRGTGGVLSGIGTPSADSDAATKAYVDAVKPTSTGTTNLSLVSGFTQSANPTRYERYGDMVTVHVGCSGTMPTGETTVVNAGGIPASLCPEYVATGGGRGSANALCSVEVYPDGSVKVVHPNATTMPWARGSVTYRRKTT